MGRGGLEQPMAEGSPVSDLGADEIVGPGFDSVSFFSRVDFLGER